MLLRFYGNVRRPNTDPSNRLLIGPQLPRSFVFKCPVLLCWVVLVVCVLPFISLTDPECWSLEIPIAKDGNQVEMYPTCSFLLADYNPIWHVFLCDQVPSESPGRGPASLTAQYSGASPSDRPHLHPSASHLRPLPFQPHSTNCVAFTLKLVYALKGAGPGQGVLSYIMSGFSATPCRIWLHFFIWS